MDAFAGLPLIDCHVHMRGINATVNLLGMIEASNLAAVNLVCVPLAGGRDVNHNALALLFKAMHPGRFYAFGGLHYEKPAGEQPDFADQARRLVRAGCDGMKMLEGKPTIRKRLGIRLDSAVYHEYYAFMESEGVPILYHVGDPAGLWDCEKMPQWARERGWFYGDGTYLSREALYDEVDGMLGLFPDLRVIFAHFYFLCDDIERASAFLDRWPNVSFDLTPFYLTPGDGYADFLKARDRWRDFFVKYQDRIVFGTDNSGGGIPDPEKIAAEAQKIRVMRTFLETDSTIEIEATSGRGLDLGPEVVGKMYAGNFRGCAGENPREVNLEMALEECDRAILYAQGRPDAESTIAELPQIRDRLQELQAA